MIYLELFLSFLQIGAFSFGGGYACLPLIQKQVVEVNQWLSMSELTDLITISQMTPGPIAVNSATFVGEKIAGIPGGIAATLGCILPSLILVSIIAYFYLKYRHLDFLQRILKTLRPAVVAMIASSGLTILFNALFGDVILFSNLKIYMLIIFGICVVLLMKYKMNPIAVMMLAGGLNLVYNLFMIG
ncbi:MAG: chromate transporter [Erysipelotrichaceae bacterium]|nr:chromate transporter [Erysipelotrichaceae bacterium]